MKIRSHLSSVYNLLLIVCVVLAAMFCPDVVLGQNAEVAYRVEYYQENADDKDYTLADLEFRTAQAGSAIPLSEITAGKTYTGFHLRGSGVSIYGFDINESTASDHIETGSASVIGYADINGNFVSTTDQTINQDGTTVIRVYFNRDRYGVYLRRGIENVRDPYDEIDEDEKTSKQICYKQKVGRIGYEIKYESTCLDNFTLPEDPFIVKNGANLYKRFFEDSVQNIKDMFNYLKSDYSSYGRWSWWAKWEGAGPNGNAYRELNINLDNVYSGFNYDVMDGPAYGLKDGESTFSSNNDITGMKIDDHIVMELKRNRRHGFPFSYCKGENNCVYSYEDYYTPWNVDGAYRTGSYVCKKIWVNKPENGYLLNKIDDIKVFLDNEDIEDESNYYKYTEIYSDENDAELYQVCFKGFYDEYSNVTYQLTYSPELTSVVVTKKWLDEADSSGRPTEESAINSLIRLKQNNSFYEATPTVTGKDTSEWVYKFSDLPKYDENNAPFVYTVEETPIDNYTSDIIKTDADGYKYTITNTYNPPLINIAITKVWDDEDDRDRERPDSVFVYVMDDKKELVRNSFVYEKNTSSEEPWTVVFTGLPKYRKNQDTGQLEEVQYSAYELYNPELSEYIGYAAEERATAAPYDIHWDIRNQYTPRPIYLPVTKTTEGGDDTFNFRIKLTKQETPDTNAITVTKKFIDTNGDKKLFALSDLSAYTAVNPLRLTLQSSSDGSTWSDVSVSSVWPNGDGWNAVEDQDAGNPGYASEWTYSFVITDDTLHYRVVESSAPSYLNSSNNTTVNFTAEDSNTAAVSNSSAVLTNTVSETASHSVTTEMISKALGLNGIYFSKDADSSAANLPTINGVELTQVNGTTDTWEFSITTSNLSGSVELVVPYGYSYEVWEVNSEGNRINPNGSPKTGWKLFSQSGTTGTTWAMGTLPEVTFKDVKQINITVTKVWDDGDNHDGIQPDKVTVTLKANGTAVGEPVELSLRGGSNWAYTFDNLDVYDANGQRITYTVEEQTTSVITGTDGDGTYAISYNPTSLEAREDATITVTNTHTPVTRELVINKIWDDAGYQDNRPLVDNYLRRNLLLTVNGVKTHFTDLTAVPSQSGKYTATVNGTPVTITAPTDKSLSPWEIRVSGLPKYRYNETAGQSEIVYGITDEYVNYIAVYDDDNSMDNGFTITNKWNRIDIQGYKTWIGDENSGNTRPGSIVVHLHGGETIIERTITESTQQISGKPWSWKFTDLPKYDSDGEEIDYWVHEEHVENYVASENPDNEYNIINTLSTDTVQVVVSKVWSDGDNRDGIRPTSATVYLKINGVRSTDPAHMLTLNETNHWRGTFSNLPERDEQGATITYDVEEADVTGYTTERSGSVARGFVFTNTHTPEKVQLQITKNWDDFANTYGERPEDPTRLLRAMRLIASTTSHGSVEYSLTNLSNPTGTNPYTYTATVLGFPVTITATMSGAKTSDPWNITITGLPKNRSGEVITWSINELPETYLFRLTNSSRDADTGNFNFTVTNFLNWQSIEITKTWDTDEDLTTEEARMKFLNGAELYANGNYYYHGAFERKSADETNKKWVYGIQAHANVTVTIEDLGNKVWKVTVDKLPRKFAATDPTEIVWTVGESLEDYNSYQSPTGTANKYAVINVEKVDIAVSKVWNDNNNQDGLRQNANAQVQLYADGQPVSGKTLDISTADNWSGTFEGLPKYNVVNNVPDRTRAIVYTVDELTNSVIKGKAETDDAAGTYKYAVTGDAASGFTITNTHTPETIKITLSKVWSDDNNRDDMRTTATVQLYANGVAVDGRTLTVPVSDSWTTDNVFSDLPKYQNGVEINYEIRETPPAGYTPTIVPGNTIEKTFKIINTHEPETVNVSVSKIWDDKNDQDGLRSKVEAKVQLFEQVGSGSKTAVAGVDPVTVGTENNWSHTFENLPKYKTGQAGAVISYSVEETITVTDSSVTGTPYTGTVSGDMTDGFVVTNKHEPSKISVTITKEWDDNSNQDGVRRSGIYYYLEQNGNIVAAYTSKNSDDFKKSGDVLTNTWSHTFENLPEYCGGTKCNYAVIEPTTPSNYTQAYKVVDGVEDKLTIINTHEPETVSVTGKKTWIDNDNFAGMRPDSITINLMADGVIYEAEDVENPKTITADSKEDETNAWSWKWEDLPKYKNVEGKGVEIVWSVAETAVRDYTTTYQTTSSAYNVTNTYNEGTKSITVKKVWNDDKNRDGIRPAYVNVYLVQNGTNTGQYKSLAEANKWTNTFTDLPIYKDGQEVVYTIAEVTVTGYTVEISELDENNTYTVTNTHVPETIDIEGYKTWVHRDLDPAPPSEIVVHLRADGADLAGMEKTVTEASEAIDGTPWSYKWEGLPKYKSGAVRQEIVYTVREEPLTNYNTTYSFPNVTNTYSPGLASVTVRKAWDDKNDQDGLRPFFVEVNLMQKVGDGDWEETGQSTILVPGSGGAWRTYTFENLPRFTTEGYPISYKVAEAEEIDGYSSAEVIDQYNVHVLTNTHDIETVTIIGEKVWEHGDQDEADWPTSVTVHLLANGTLVAGQEKIITAAMAEVDGKAWTWKWEDLPKKANGEDIRYTISEDPIADYTYEPKWTTSTDADGNTTLSLVLTNTYNPGEITIRVQKVWDDNNNNDGKQPDSIEVKLMNGETVVERATLPDADGYWRAFFTVPEYDENDQKITYTVTETFTDILTEDQYNVPGKYVMEPVALESENSYVITNAYTPETVSIHGVKTWDDTDAPDGARPDAVTLTLLADGTGIAYTVAQEADNWEWSFPDQPKYADGEEITYKVIEYPAVDGYEVTTSVINVANDYDYTITNTYKPESVSVKVTKVWDDADNQDGLRPGALTINLYKNGDTDTVINTLTLPVNGEWSGSFTDLPKYEEGVEIQYTVDEAAFTNSSKYAKAITGDMSQGFTITNTHVPETITVKGTKVWVDPDASTRPDHITLELLANSKRVDLAVGQAPDYAWEFDPQPKFAGGKLIDYVVAEFDVPGYTRDPQEKDKTDSEIIYVVTNTYNPEAITLRVTKDWEDDNDHDGFRPDSLTVTLWQGEGESKTQVRDDNDDPVTLTLTADGRWTGTFQNLPKYDQNRVAIKYSVDEADFEYSTQYDKKITGDMTEGYIITNTHVPETITIRGTKVWDDADAPEGSRPERIALELKANNVHQAYAIGYAASDYAWEFTDLDKYADGAEIQYVVTEISPEGYVPKVERLSKTATEMIYQVTNTYAPDKVRIRVSKNWNDLNNRDGYRPDSLTINLYQVVDGENVPVEGKTLELNAANRWTDVLMDLPKYDEHENEIVYTVDEEDFTHSDQYVKNITGSIAEGFTITNTYTPETVTIEGTKVWVGDEDVPEGTRPDHVTIQVSANGKVVNTAVATEESDWEWSFGELPKYENSVEIDYTVQEYTVPGYTKDIVKAEDSYYFTVTNTYNPDETTVRVTKSWSDGNNQDGIRPASITVNLFKGEGNSKELVTDENGDPLTLTLNAASRWTGTFDHLPKYEEQAEIVYSVDEETFDKLTGDRTTGYERTLSGNMTSGYVITNTHTPETLTISGTKVWDHKDAPEEKYPSHATIELMADGVVKAITTATEDTGWKWSFTNLPKYRYDGEKAHLINYTFSEYSIRDYDVEYGADNTITNTYQSNITSVQVTKEWDDSDNRDNLRDKWVLIKLLENGEETDRMAILNEGNGWTHTFHNLEIEQDGEEIVYTVEEQESSTITGIDGPGTYAVKVTGDVEKGFIVKNTHTPEFIDISGQKIWDDDDDNDGLRPASITIRLLADGKEAAHVEVTESDGWAWKFTGLPKYSGSNKIRYTVEEDPVGEYSRHVSGDADTGFTVTNNYTPGKTSVSVSKVWEDHNNQDGKRPASVTVNLLANGKQVNSEILTANNNWEHTFEELPEMEDGQAIVYSVEEVSVPEGYTSEISGDASSTFTITNTYTPETVNIPVEKIWDDSNNQDGVRPMSITIRLLANGNEVDHVVLQEGEVEHTFINKPVYHNTHPILYSVSEDSIKNYNVHIEGSVELGFTVKNTYEPDITSLHVSKVWEDDDDRDGIRPSVITVNLLANGKQVDSHPLSKENGWEYEFEELPVKDNGEEITYKVEEVTVDGYVSTIEGNAISGYKIVNAHTPEKVAVRGKKIWVDNDNAAGVRPESIIVRLHANEVEIDSQSVRADAQGNWQWAFRGLPKYADEREIVYTITEDTTDEYSAAITGNAEDGFTITNTYAENTTSLFVSKHWSDNYDTEGRRPKSVKVNVLADYGDGKGYVPTEYSGVITGSSWEYIFNGLPLTVDGVRVKYSVTEEKIPDYTSVVEGDAKTGYTITNVHEREFITVSGQKTWNDNNDSAKARPEAIIVHLNSDGTLLHEVRVTAEDDWKWSFSNLPKYENGKEIVYTLHEEPVDNYEPTMSDDDFNITNNYKSGKRTLPVDVAWIDVNNQDGIRPGSVTIKLFMDGEDTGLTLVLDESNEWRGSFTELDICSANPKGVVSKAPSYEDICAAAGTKHAVYTVQEVHTDVITGENTEKTYTDEYVGSSHEGWTVLNRHTPVTIDVTGSKTWSGNGPLPASIIVRLLAENEEILSHVVTPSEEGTWSWSFTGLPKNKNGQPINYSISEDKVDGFETDINDFDITNRYTPGYTSLQVVKVWDDNENGAGKRPEYVTVRLLANGSEKGTITLNADNNWAHEYKDLPISDASGTITYTVEEVTVPEGYKAVVAGNMEKGYEIINSYILETIDVSVTKSWVGSGEHPDSVMIELLTNGARSGQTLTLNERGAWTGQFADLPKTDSAGAVITYSVMEVNTPDGYRVSYSGNMQSGFVVTNTKRDEPTPPTPPEFFRIGGELPETGITTVSGFDRANMPASVSYVPTEMMLQIPTLNVMSSIVEIEPENGRYPVEWLGFEAGLLEGTAKPGEGISVLAAHNTLNKSEYGPFALILEMEEGDRFFITDEDGSILIFQVYANEKIGSHDYDALWKVASEFGNTVTLLTCEDERTEGGYASRRVIAARRMN